MEVPVKAWWQSKVIWVNVGLVAVEVVAQLLPELQARIAGGSTLWLLGLGALVNTLLRLYGTAQPVTVTAALRPVQARTLVVRPTPEPGLLSAARSAPQPAYYVYHLEPGDSQRPIGLGREELGSLAGPREGPLA